MEIQPQNNEGKSLIKRRFRFMGNGKHFVLGEPDTRSELADEIGGDAAPQPQPTGDVHDHLVSFILPGKPVPTPKRRSFGQQI